MQRTHVGLCSSFPLSLNGPKSLPRVPRGGEGDQGGEGSPPRPISKPPTNPPSTPCPDSLQNAILLPDSFGPTPHNPHNPGPRRHNQPSMYPPHLPSLSPDRIPSPWCGAAHPEATRRVERGWVPSPSLRNTRLHPRKSDFSISFPLQASFNQNSYEFNQSSIKVQSSSINLQSTSTNLQSTSINLQSNPSSSQRSRQGLPPKRPSVSQRPTPVPLGRGPSPPNPTLPTLPLCEIVPYNSGCGY